MHDFNSSTTLASCAFSIQNFDSIPWTRGLDWTSGGHWPRKWCWSPDMGSHKHPTVQNSLSRWLCHHLHLCTLQATLTHGWFCLAFVDNTNLMVMDNSNDKQVITKEMQDSLLLLHGILQATGGDLFPKKCFWSLWQLLNKFLCTRPDSAFVEFMAWSLFGFPSGPLPVYVPFSTKETAKNCRSNCTFGSLPKIQLPNSSWSWWPNVACGSCLQDSTAHWYQLPVPLS